MAIKEKCFQCSKFKQNGYDFRCTFIGKKPNFDGTQCSHFMGNPDLKESSFHPMDKEEDSQEQKFCPFCSKKIDLDAINCKHCKKWIRKTDQKYDDFKIQAHPPLKVWQKILGFSYYLTPTAYILKQFSVNGNLLYIETTGDLFKAPIDECKFRRFSRKGHTYLRFYYEEDMDLDVAELSYILSDDEWDYIKNFCYTYLNQKPKGADEIAIDMLEKVKDVLDYLQ